MNQLNEKAPEGRPSDQDANKNILTVPYHSGKEMSMKQININFLFDKETKGTLRFKEVSDDPVIGTIYIKKSALQALEISDKDKLVIDLRKETI